MKKKTRATASGAGKRSKSVASGQKVAPRQSSAPGSRPPAVSNGTRATIRRLKAQLARTQAQIEQLQASADTDFLLGIPNRRGFERELCRAIAYIKRYRAGGALVILDVDRLKPINDAFGHAAGDQVLKAIAATLIAQVRASDVVGRLGGDEFAVLLWNLSETDARAKAAMLEEAIDRLTFVFEAAALPRAHPRASPFSIPTPNWAARWKRPTVRCMCERRCGGTRPTREYVGWAKERQRRAHHPSSSTL